VPGQSLSIEIELRPTPLPAAPAGLLGGVCHQRGTAYDLLTLRRFDFLIPILGLRVLLLYTTMRGRL